MSLKFVFKEKWFDGKYLLGKFLYVVIVDVGKVFRIDVICKFLELN